MCPFIVYFVFHLVAGSADGQPVTPAEQVGMSTSRLARAEAVLRTAVETRVAGSAVGLIARDGKIVFLSATGELEPGVPMRPDAIARMASIGKTVTATAILMLYEEGKLRLDDPVARFIPEFAGVKVEVADPATGRTTLVPPTRAITIHDLLTHSAGLVTDRPELEALLAKADPPEGGGTTVGEFAAALAGLPLRAQPGTRFDYGFYGPSYEVLAAVAERASGQPFDELLQQRVLAPLRMNDTFFRVPEAKLDRLAGVYKRDAAGQLVVLRRRGEEEKPSRFRSGGGALRGTVSDFFRFAQMLLDGGELDGVRLLGPKTVQLMTSNHVGDRFQSRTGDYGWGLGAAVRTRVLGDGVGSVGSFGWNGGTGTLYLVDPVERLVVVVFLPSQPGTPGVGAVRNDFVTAAYCAIVRSYEDPRPWKSATRQRQPKWSQAVARSGAGREGWRHR